MAYTLATRGQWDRPLRDRCRDDLAAEARRAALTAANAADLEELGIRLGFAAALRRNGDQYAGHVGRLMDAGQFRQIHINSLASIRHQAEDAEAKVSDWWAEHAPEPDDRAIDARTRAVLALGWLDAPADLPTIAAPSDGLGVPDEGLRFLGETKGRRHPDGSVRRPPLAMFVRDTDRSIWIRNAKGELRGYTGGPPCRVLATRAV